VAIKEYAVPLLMDTVALTSLFGLPGGRDVPADEDFLQE